MLAVTKTNECLEGLTYKGLEQVLAAGGVNPVHARQLFSLLQRSLFQRDRLPLETLPPPVDRWLASNMVPAGVVMHPVDETPSADGFTRKYLLQLGDGAEVESVQMGFTGRFTACLSSQVGCAMGCLFCATGKMGFGRNLTAGEIVAQAHHVERELRRTNPGERLRNIVMMGMGEPLHNYDATMTALEILTDTRGLNIGPARIAISTVGYVPGIQKLARHPKRYSLAVSLHGASDEERLELVPLNKRWPLSELLDACREYSALKKARVFFAWTLIKGVNDSDDHARRLADLLKGMDAHVNLIPLNVTEGYDGEPPDDARVRSFQQIIQGSGLPSTVRQRRGLDVNAGCGQLKAKRIRREIVTIKS